MMTSQSHRRNTLKEEGELSDEDDDSHSYSHRQSQWNSNDSFFADKPLRGSHALGHVLERGKTSSIRHDSKHSRRNESSRSKRWNYGEMRESSASSNSGSLDENVKRHKNSHTRSHTRSPQRQSKCILLNQPLFSSNNSVNFGGKIAIFYQFNNHERIC